MLQILNIGASAQEMKSVGSDLQSKMESSLRFVSMNGINDSTADINEAVKNAAMISDQNQNRIDSLYSEIRKFKV